MSKEERDASHWMSSSALIEPARMGSETARTIEEPLEGLERLSSSNDWRYSFTTPIQKEN